MFLYTADLHFGHSAVLERAERPFASVEEMDEVLIRNWNRVVAPEDTVYVAGDLCSYGRYIPHEYLSRLSGHKHLIRGNHDTGLDNQEELFDYFESVTDFLEIDDQGYHITICHYPIVYIQGGYMIHGHVHNMRGEIFRILKNLPRVMNAGVDVNNYRPVTLGELIRNNRIFYNDPTRGSDPPPDREKKFAGCARGGWKADFRPLPIKREE